MDSIVPIKDVPFGMNRWTSKITVQERQHITSSMDTPTKKQKFVLVDAEGSKVEAIMFNADIPIMSPKIEVYKKYLISNAEVRKIPDAFKTPELAAQWVITTRTIVEEVADDEDIIPSTFNCIKFADLAQFMDQKDKSVDILGIVVTALEKKLINRKEKDSYVQKFVIVNENFQTIMLSMWDAFIENEGAQITADLQNYPVLIGRRLKVQNYNGVSLTTWFNSAILIDPPVQEARALKNWAMRNSKQLANIVDQRAYSKFNPDISFRPDQRITDIINITPNQRAVWVKVSFSFENIFQRLWYMACEKCFRSTSADHGVIFMCNTCNKKYKAAPRCRIDVDLADDSGTITATLFGDLAEKLLTFTAVEAMEHFNQNLELPLGTLHQQLKTKKFLAHVKPVQTPLANGKRRYTMQHYEEISDGAHSIPTVEEESSFPKTKLSLIDRFNNCDDPQETASSNSEASKNKKARKN